MWKQANLGNGNANQKHAHDIHKQMKKLKSLSVILLLLISTSIVFIKPGWTQSTLAIKVEPSYVAGKYPDSFEVKLNIYGANASAIPATNVAMWQVQLTWSPAVLELNTTIVFGDFMDGFQIGEWGLLLYDATAGENVLNVADGSVYQVGYSVLIKDDLHQETNTVTGVTGTQLTLQNNLAYNYTVADNGGCYPDPPDTRIPTYSQSAGRVTLGVSFSGPAPGASGDGWLATLRFLVQQNADSLLNIDNENTYIQNTYGQTFGDEVGEMDKESGQFLSMHPEDAKPDGLIDVFDIYTVGKNWQKCPVQQKIPTTTSGDWTNPTYAYMTDDLRATAATKDWEQVYGGFGFVTGLWTGVSKVEVGVERSATSTGCDDSLKVEISNNGGSSWSGTSVTTVINWLSDRFVWLDFTAAYSWTPSGAANIAVRITFVKGDNTLHTIRVDWITVRVTPTPTSTSIYADVNADSLVNAPDLALQAASYGLDYRP